MSRSERILFVLLCALSILPLWIVQYIPIQDYPSHLLFTKIISHYNDPLLDFGSNFSMSYPLVPNLMFQMATAVLSYLFPLQIAGKIFLSLCIMGLPVSLLYLMDAAKKKNHLLGLTGFLFSYNWFFHLGLLNYVASIIIFAFALGFWLRNRSSMTMTRVLIFFILTLLLFFSHLMSYVLLVGVILFFTIKEKTTDKFLFVLIPTLLLTIAYLAFSRNFSSPWGFTYYGIITDLQTLLLPVYSYTPGAFSYVFLPSYLFFGTLLFMTLYKDWRILWHDSFFLIFLGLIFLYFISPYHFSEWGYVKVRILPYIFIFLLMMIKFPAHAFARNGFIVSVVILSLGSLYLTAAAYRKIDPYLTHYASLLEQIPPKKTLFAIPREGKSYLMPSLHFESYYHIQRGGRSPNIFPGPFGMIAYKNPIPSPDLRTPKDLEKTASFYEYVVMNGRHPDLAKKLASRYRRAGSQGNFSLFVRHDEYDHFIHYSKTREPLW